MEVSVSDLAKMKGVSQQAISKRLRRLMEDGLITPRHEGGRTLVNLAAWDSVTNEVTDPAKIVARDTAALMKPRRAAETADPAEGALRDPTYTQQQARKAGYDADLKEIELRRLQGELREVDDIRASTIKVGEIVVRELDQLPSFADDIAAAFAKGGIPALRDELKRRCRAMRETIVRSLADLAAGSIADDGEEKAN